MSSKGPCKFFAQGYCRNGNSCPYSHQLGNNNRNNSNNYNDYNSNYYGGGSNKYNNNYNNNSRPGSSYGNNNNVKKGGPETPQEFASPNVLKDKSAEIKKDMDEISRELSLGLMFTSYSLKPPTNVNLITGRDMSFEEMRLKYYEARQQNTVQNYEQEVNARKTDMIKCKDFLKRESEKGARLLQLAVSRDPSTVKPFIDFPLQLAPPASGIGSSIFGGGNLNSNPFGSQGATNPFGSGTANNSAPAFGQSAFGAGSGGPFGNQSLSTPTSSSSSSTTTALNKQQNPFGSQIPTTNSFGTVPATTSTPASGAFGASGFGSASKPGLFGASPSNNSAPVGTNLPANPFGSSSATAAGAFGSHGFGQSAGNKATSTLGNSGFGSSNATGTGNNTGSVFGSSGFGKASGSAFGLASTPAGLAPVTMPTSAFGQSSTGFSFGNSSQPIASAAAVSSSSPFGGAAASGFGGSSFGGGTSGFGQGFEGGSSVTIYVQGEAAEEGTKMEDLTAEVIKLFEAPAFSLGQVPDVPPPIALC